MFDQVAKLVEPARVLATVGIVVGIAVTLAQSVWSFAIDPTPERTATAPAIQDQPSPRADVERIAAMHLFGAPGVEQSSATDLDQTPDTRLNLVLAAVFEASDPAASWRLSEPRGGPPRHIGSATRSRAERGWPRSTRSSW